MTRLNVKSDLFMLPASLSRSPVAPVCSARSDPAKSTRFKTLTKVESSLSIDCKTYVMKLEK